MECVGIKEKEMMAIDEIINHRSLSASGRGLWEVLYTTGVAVLLGLWAFPYTVWHQVVAVLTVLCFVVDMLKEKTLRDWHWSGCRGWFVIAVLTGMLPLWWAGQGGTEAWIPYLEMMLPMLLFGVLGLLNTRRFPIEKLVWIPMMVMCGKSLWLWCHVDWSLLTENLGTCLHVLNRYRWEHGETHMTFNMYGNMTLVLGYHVLRKRSSWSVWNLVMVGAMAVIVLTMLFTDGRAGLMGMGVVLVGIAMTYLWQRSRKGALLVGVLLALAAGGGVAYQTRIRRSYFDNHDPRYYINHLSYRMCRECPILGYGPVEAHERFVREALADEEVVNYYINPFFHNELWHTDATEDQMHPHNVPVEMRLAYGYPGLVLIVALLLAACLLAPRTVRIEVTMAVAVFAIQAMFEVLGSNLSPFMLMVVVTMLYYSGAPLKSSADTCP